MSTLNNADHIDAFRENSYRLDKTASDTKSTRFFICIETVQEKLYWYNQYGGILTSSNAIIFPCALSDENIGVMIWRTRCNNPVNHLLVYDVLSKSCYLFKRSWASSLRCGVTDKKYSSELKFSCTYFCFLISFHHNLSFIGQ